MKTPWDFVENSFRKNEPVTPDNNQFPQYHPVIRLLSFFPSLLKSMAFISQLQVELPSWAVGCLIYNTVPHSRIPKSYKYISAKSETEKSAELETIKRVFCVNIRHGKQIMKILQQKEIGLGQKGKANGDEKSSKSRKKVR